MLQTSIITPDAVQRLVAHKYKSSGQSLLDPALTGYWNFVVSLFPLWVAPNLITFVGLMINVITTVIMVYYNPTASDENEVPRWVYLTSGLGLWVYQTLDSIDGKQARRTGTSTPLGELFDHGCDSLSAVLVTTALSISLEARDTGLLFYLNLMCNLTFYCAHWHTYVTGTLRFGRLDVTEVQLTFITCHILTAVFGPGMWSVDVYGPFRVKEVVLGLSVIGAFRSVISNLDCINKGGPGTGGTTVAETSVLAPLLPFLIYAVLTSYLSQYGGFYDEYPMVFLLCSGMVFVKIANKLIVAHMSKSSLPQLDSMFMYMLLPYINYKLGLGLKEAWFIYVLCALFVFDTCLYAFRVCREMAFALNVDVFRIKPKLKPT
eukprot:m.18375 g.18375  ORF g.18375 m.18375 type:complete len:376 (-) comp5708_c0_seq1:308-1435(-)